jgi:hypothetical protein
MKRKNVFGVSMVALLFALYLVGCGGGTSALVGKWVPEEGQSIPAAFIETSAEFSKDGTGIIDNWSLKWTAENGRLTLKFDNGYGFAYDYEISGSTLTITNDDGESVKYKKE